MDLELRDYLDAKFAGVDGKFAELRTELRTEMDARFPKVDKRRDEVDGRLAGLYKWFREEDERFAGWKTELERVRALGSAKRLSMLEDRVSAIERRLDLPPL
jgi:hypothetical protein